MRIGFAAEFLRREMRLYTKRMLWRYMLLERDVGEYPQHKMYYCHLDSSETKGVNYQSYYLQFDHHALKLP